MGETINYCLGENLITHTHRTAFMDELVLDDQRCTADDRVRSCVLDDGHKVIAAHLHLGETAYSRPM